MIRADERGLACAGGAFHVDPWGEVAEAIITHAHGDHARAGSGVYHCAREGEALLRHRIGEDATIVPHGWGEPFELGGARVSLHPAGHVRGSAQVRIEGGGEVWVVTGDFKRQADPTCTPFEAVPCDVLITEATFALPVFRWPDTDAVIEEVLAWWDENRAAGRASILLSYALGKAQRILAELARRTDRPVWTHGAVEGLVARYREAGVPMLPTQPVADAPKGTSFAGALVLAPPSARGSRWMRRFGDHEVGFASGWMRVRGPRRRRAIARGFVLSDHVDWPDLLRTIDETGAKRVLVTHGYREALARHLREGGLDAQALETAYEGEEETA